MCCKIGCLEEFSWYYSKVLLGTNNVETLVIVSHSQRVPYLNIETYIVIQFKYAINLCWEMLV